jgi:hypothetical protein
MATKSARLLRRPGRRAGQGRHQRRPHGLRARCHDQARGASLLDLLDELAIEYSLHATDQLSIRVADLAEIDAMLDRLGPTRRASSAVWRWSPWMT